MVIFFKDSSSFLCTDALPAYMYVHYRHAWCPQRPEEGVVSPETSVTDDCESPGGCWELKWDPLQE